MARLAAVLDRRPGKLNAVLIPVAIRACRETNAIQRSRPGRRVALGAGYGGVAAIQRKLGGTVRFDVQGCRLPAVRPMARGALAAVRARRELTSVGRSRVTVQAASVRDRILEVAALVALAADQRGMLARQRELRLGVIELRSDMRGLPGFAGVAGLAGSRERGPVRILVAGVAG